MHTFITIITTFSQTFIGQTSLKTFQQTCQANTLRNQVLNLDKHIYCCCWTNILDMLEHPTNLLIFAKHTNKYTTYKPTEDKIL